MQRKNWAREELLLAFNLYCKLPFGQFDDRNPSVNELARLIGRSPSAVAMKLSNFASLDPYHQQRGIRGLSNSSQADKAIWDEFHGDWERLAVESETILAHITGRASETLVDLAGEDAGIFQGPTEAEIPVKVRLAQRFFRATVLSSYRDCCCVCGIPVRNLLVASHIIPWRDRADLRVNPKNGLCLCALHDKAFDRGLIAVTPDYVVLISPEISQYMPNAALSNSFEIYSSRKINLPDKFIPEPEYLDFHVQHYFRRS